jgi:hypothetical protein
MTTQDSEQSEVEPLDAIKRDADKSTPSVALHTTATPTQEVESSEDEHRDAIRHDSGKPTPSVDTPIALTPTQISEKKARLGLGTPCNAMLTN